MPILWTASTHALMLPALRRDSQRSGLVALLCALALCVPCVALLAVGQPARPELRWGVPTAVEAALAGYVRGHCGHYTEWVAEYLTAKNLTGDVPRAQFREDKNTPIEFRALLEHYRNSGWQRGHLPCAANHHGSQAAMRDCFLLSAMAPQTLELNERHTAWEGLEEHCREIALSGAEVWVFTGPAFLPTKSGSITIRTLGDGAIWIPTHFWKAALIRRGDVITLRAWLMPNVNHPPHWQDCRKSIDEIEAAAGLDLFSGLDDELEQRLEAGDDK